MVRARRLGPPNELTGQRRRSRSPTAMSAMDRSLMILDPPVHLSQKQPGKLSRSAEKRTGRGPTERAEVADQVSLVVVPAGQSN